MAKLTFKSPGVSTREIDLSQPSAISPSGVPAGVIGTSVRGPAFVPITVATFQDFIAKFGNTDGEKFGPLAMDEWFKEASAGTYVRILGAGDGKKRSEVDLNKGKVNNAGFVVGSPQVQANGFVGNNPHAKADNAKSRLGRTYFLGTFAQEAAGSTMLQDAGLTNPGIIRGVIMTPSGVHATLGTRRLTPAQNEPSLDLATHGGSPFGDVVTGSAKQEFVMILNGHKKSDVSEQIITASFDPTAPNYFGDIFNTEATKIEEEGYYLFAKYDISQTELVVTATNHTEHNDAAGGMGRCLGTAFLLSGSAAHNSGTVGTGGRPGVPNYEGFEDRYQTAHSPFIISQKFGGQN